MNITIVSQLNKMNLLPLSNVVVTLVSKFYLIVQLHLSNSMYEVCRICIWLLMYLQNKPLQLWSHRNWIRRQLCWRVWLWELIWNHKQKGEQTRTSFCMFHRTDNLWILFSLWVVRHSLINSNLRVL